ncbi:MAG: polyphosphate kinase 1 [Flavobacteriales bacterium]|nr:polyphosphate kinase 1 [Flavobacteriales bacterium]
MIAQLKTPGIFIVEKVPEYAKEYLSDFFKDKILPQLYISLLKEKNDFPTIEDNIIHLMCILRLKNGKKTYAIITLPKKISRWVVLPKKDDTTHIMFIEDVVKHFLPYIFAHMEIVKAEAHAFKISRDCELDIDDFDVSRSIVEKVARSLAKRGNGHTVHMTHECSMPASAVKYISHRLSLTDVDGISKCTHHLSLRDFTSFPFSLGRKEDFYAPYTPIPLFSVDEEKDIRSQIQKKDRLLYCPYNSYRAVLALLRQAASDPQVTRIRITLYRLADDSQVITALKNAARSGKQVWAQIELRARFDEMANLHWAEDMKNEGVRLTYGVEGLKVHAKMCVIDRIGDDGQRESYGFVSTGNFNESTSRLYTDYILFTSHSGIMKDMADVFDFMSKSYRPKNYSHLLVSPTYMRKKLYKLIDGEVKAVEKGQEGLIRLRVNSMTDTGLIEKLHYAATKGVKVQAVVRGACSMVPCLDAPNIRIISIVDRFLEHQRVYAFGTSSDAKVYISSADFMTRNMDYRVEVATPVYDQEIKRDILAHFDIAFNDNVKATLPSPSGEITPVPKDNENPIRTQEDTYFYIMKKYGDHSIKS